MIQLFEQTSIDANCDIGPNDTPFTMPLLPTDHIFLRLQVPYYLVEANGGGLPIGANISVSIFNIAGDSQLCGYGVPADGKYLYNFVNNATLRVGEYRFMIPLRLPDDYITKSYSATTGDIFVATLDGVVYTWVYGVDPLPYPFIDYKPGYICIRKADAAVLTVNKNGSGAIGSDVFVDDNVSCFTDTCFRVRIAVTFGATTYYYFTKQFQMALCDEETVFIKSDYPLDMQDCAGEYFQGNQTDLGVTELYLRLRGGYDRVPSKLTKTYNSRCYQYRSEIAKQIRLRTEPMPEWYQDAVETLTLGRNFTLNGIPYQMETENIFENSDNVGSVFQNINVLLSQCKCEKVFVC